MKHEEEKRTNADDYDCSDRFRNVECVADDSPLREIMSKRASKFATRHPLGGSTSALVARATSKQRGPEIESVPLDSDLDWLPTALRNLIQQDLRGQPRGVKALLDMYRVVVWQMDHISRLEAKLKVMTGNDSVLECLYCGSRHLQIEHRNGQRRIECQDCGMLFRLGVRQI